MLKFSPPLAWFCLLVLVRALAREGGGVPEKTKVGESGLRGFAAQNHVSLASWMLALGLKTLTRFLNALALTGFESLC
ncbi:hypothetical protein HMPREF0576_1150 [Mobiluncus holmesii ATCC 35242]|uniref:Uncharacterized protein n=1 Tax=Mobiluncus holmesii ATCC 35242 TaxID=887899 RepID=E6M4G8_9ACTO|nr:hypothetical protein HMPREF0576_1150 [Mobiluncus holmesii ATCC 35242]